MKMPTIRRSCSNHSASVWLLQSSILIGLLLATSGCGGGGDRQPTAPLHGKVIYKGEPLKTGSIVFIPAGGGPSGKADINSDGTYIAGTYEKDDGVIPGEHQVMITAVAEPSASALPEESISGNAPVAWTIPQRYGDPAQSGLTASVKPDTDNVADFELTD